MQVEPCPRHLQKVSGVCPRSNASIRISPTSACITRHKIPSKSNSRIKKILQNLELQISH